MCSKRVGSKSPIRKIIGDQKGITGLETAIILIAFVIVATVSTISLLSAGMFIGQQGHEAIGSGLQAEQGSIELRDDVLGYKDTLNTNGNGSLGRIELTVVDYSDSGQINLTPSYTIDPDTGALINSNPDANQLHIDFIDQNLTIKDCVWTVTFIGPNNGDTILDFGEKAVISVWLHAYDGTNWGPPDSEGNNYLGTDYLDTNHTFTLELYPANGAATIINRTTPDYLDPVVDLH